ncbi:hypothetical protein CK203_095409 [Vitis vinifera]|uniref:Uncharacterized protein n=1 Tax=Vitis vinifera TaxID=29760 RepID=A0A438CW51_VITVI|nr:hypothetical protein CK203_095409 [Vitis vinifera]
MKVEVARDMSLLLWMIFRDTPFEGYILRDGENLGKFDAKSDVESIGDNLKDVEITKDLNDILERDIDPNKDEIVPLDDTYEEMRNKYRSKVLKSHPISNVIGNVNESVVSRRQSTLNEMGLVCYTSKLEPKNVEEALGDESWTTTLQEELNQFIRNDVCYLVPSNDKHAISTK